MNYRWNINIIMLKRITFPFLKSNCFRCFSTNQTIAEKYYKKTFTNELEYLEQKKPYPLFRVMDLEGNIINNQYENIDKDICLKVLDTMFKVREVDQVYQNAQRQGRISFFMTSKFEEAAILGVATGTSPDDGLFFQYKVYPLLLYRGWITIKIPTFTCRLKRSFW